MKTKSAPRLPTRPDAARHRAPARLGAPTLANSWLDMPWSMRILRAFLGVTFVFAGVQKFLDPNFLHAGSPTYIGTQLDGFITRGTPIAPLMHLLARFPFLTGVGVALTEIAVGLGTLMGVGLMAAAVVGLAINLTLWFSATWHVHPYFLGSDSIYAVAWAALLAGAWEAERARFPGRMLTFTDRVEHLSRREVMRGGLVAGAAVGLAALGSAMAGPLAKGPGGLAHARAAGPGTATGAGSQVGPSSAPSGAVGASGASGAGSSSVQGKVLTTLDQLPVGSAVGFTAPGGIPAALVRLANGKVVAYSRICTHAGCAVGYDTNVRLLVCPCHGAEFDPAKHADPLPGGPTNIPLPPIRVVVDQATGQVILPQ